MYVIAIRAKTSWLDQPAMIVERVGQDPVNSYAFATRKMCDGSMGCDAIDAVLVAPFEIVQQSALGVGQ